MSPSRLIAIETATPPLRFSQKKILEHILQKDGLSQKSLLFYKRFLLDKGIQTRHFGLKNIQQVFSESTDEAASRFQKVGTKISHEAVQLCLKKAHMAAKDIDGLIVTSCTGYLCPGLTSYLTEKSGFRKNIFALDLVGLGCGAAVPALRAADQFLKSGAGNNVLILCAEVCSAALYWGDEVDLILSNSIFSDGAAACLLSNDLMRPGFEPVRFESLLWPRYRDHLRFKPRDGRLCNVLSPKVPDIAAKAARFLWGKLSGKTKKKFDHYAIHPGGRLILDRIEKELHLKSKDMISSRTVLRDFGNMSSPSILFVLKDIWEKHRFQDQETVAMFTFGAGFSAHSSVFKYTS